MTPVSTKTPTAGTCAAVAEKPIYTYASCVTNKKIVRCVKAKLFENPEILDLYASSCCVGSARPRAVSKTTGDVFFQSSIRVLHPVKSFSFPYKEDPLIACPIYEDSKHILMQQSPEGCSAACSASLALDKGKLLPLSLLKNRKAAPCETILEDLEIVGLHAVSTNLDRLKTKGSLDILKLDELIFKQGPACIRIQEAFSEMAHWIIVDEINYKESTVMIRDPWHGFLMDIDLEIFIQQWKRPYKFVSKSSPDFTIQVIDACE